MRRFPLAALPILAVTMGVTPALGQEVPSPYEFIDTRHQAGFFVGAASDNRGSLDLGPGGGVYFGGRYGLELGGPFAIEGTAFLLPTDRNVYDPSDPDEGLQLLGSTTSTVAGIDGRLRFTLTGNRTWNDLAPFAVVGGGLAFDLSRDSPLEEDLFGEERFSFGPSFLGVLGLGSRWLPTDRLTVRADALLHIWRLGTPEAFFQFEGENGLGSISDQEWTGVGVVTLGGAYRF